MINNILNKAKNIIYKNSNGKLSANNVQGALDELSNKVARTPEAAYGNNGLENLAFQIYKAPNGTSYLQMIITHNSGTKRTVTLDTWT